MNDLNFSVVVPVYNSSGYIKDLVNEIALSFSNTGYTFEILLVDDSSTDNTVNFIEHLMDKNPIPLRLIRLKKNYGQYIATLVGLHLSTGNSVITIDADFCPHPKYIKALIEKRGKNDELVYGEFIVKNKPLVRRVGGFVFNSIIKLATQKNILNRGSSFRLIKRQLLTRVLNHLYTPALLDITLMKETDHVNFLQLSHVAEHKSVHSRLKIWGATFRLFISLLAPGVTKNRTFTVADKLIRVN
jgi:glycosyltransferase involved in cell wall biosynthesis